MDEKGFKLRGVLAFGVARDFAETQRAVEFLCSGEPTPGVDNYAAYTKGAGLGDHRFGELTSEPGATR